MMNDTEKRLLRTLMQLHEIDRERHDRVMEGVDAVVADLKKRADFDWDAYFAKISNPKASHGVSMEYYRVYITGDVVHTKEVHEASRKLEQPTLVPADPTFSPLQEELAEFAKDIQKPYYFHTDPPFGDFNKDYCAPGLLDKFPDGVLGIRCDDDFWSVAGLPVKFNDLEIPEIVEVLWPDYLEEAHYGPDVVTTAEDIAQSEYFKKLKEEQKAKYQS